MHFPDAPYATPSPDEAVAPREKFALPYVRPGSDANVIDCAALAIEKLCCTCGAALKSASPSCEAVTVQEPAPVMCTVVGFASEQFPFTPNDTGRPDVAVALSEKSPSP